MKTILLIRHAKSSWTDISVEDEERPLNDRGKRNAPEMASRLRKKKIEIDLFVSSPAKRARSTAEYFAEEYGVPKKDIILIPELYMASHDAFIKVIHGLPPSADSVAIFSHNNGITSFANELSEARVDEMPTCAIFAVKCDIAEWSDFKTRENHFFFFDHPKA